MDFMVPLVVSQRGRWHITEGFVQRDQIPRWNPEQVRDQAHSL